MTARIPIVHAEYSARPPTAANGPATTMPNTKPPARATILAILQRHDVVTRAELRAHIRHVVRCLSVHEHRRAEGQKTCTCNNYVTFQSTYDIHPYLTLFPSTSSPSTRWNAYIANSTIISTAARVAAVDGAAVSPLAPFMS